MWYDTKQAELEKLEQLDEMWIRDLMDGSSSVLKALLYLELSILPFRYVIQIRRFSLLSAYIEAKEGLLII